jgi:hypothetical protein
MKYEKKRSQCGWLALIAIGSLLLGAPRPSRADSSHAPTPDRPAPADADSILGGVPLTFVENHGQWEPRIRFLARREAMTAWLEKDAVTLRFVGGKPGPEGSRATMVRLRFEGASPSVRLEGHDRTAGEYNYRVGRDRSRWRGGVPGFGRVVYRGLYPGIDLLFRESGTGALEYDLELHPGADLSRVVVRCDGIERFRIEDGALILESSAGEIRQPTPTTWHRLPSGKTEPVVCRYRRIDERSYGFEVPGWDRSLALVIDPALEWSTYLGGSGNDEINVVDHRIVNFGSDSFEEIVVAGATRSVDFPLRSPTPGQPMQLFNASLTFQGTNAFYGKFDRNGTLIYMTYFGGSGNDTIADLAQVPGTTLDVVVGRTSSPDLPMTNPGFQTTIGGADDGFLAIVVTGGFGAGDLLSLTYCGGSGIDSLEAVDIASNGEVTAVGQTVSPPSNFPATPGDFSSPGGGADALIVRYSPTLSNLLNRIRVGGANAEFTQAVHVDGSIITIAGRTAPSQSAQYPTTPSAPYLTYRGGASDAFVSRFDLDQTGPNQLVFSTFLGGSLADDAIDLAVEGSEIWVGGETSSNDFPTTSGAVQPSSAGGADGFLVGLDPTLGGPVAVVASTYFGGTGEDRIAFVEVQSGVLTIGGGTTSSDLGTTLGAFQPTFGGFRDAFVARLAPGLTRTLYASYLGGSASDAARAGALDATSGEIYLAGRAAPGFPVTPGAQQEVFAGGSPFFGPPRDAFLARMSGLPAGVEHYRRGALVVGVDQQPRQGDADFAVYLTGVPAGGLCAVVIGFHDDPVGVEPPNGVGRLHVRLIPGSFSFVVLQADARGYVRAPFPIPVGAAGATVYLQAASIDPSSSSIVFSSTLQLTVQN